jgi:hypothetical protein
MKIIKSLVIINIVLIILHLFFCHININLEPSLLLYEIGEKFNMDNEISIPTWFAQTLLFIIALLFALTYIDEKRKEWLFLSLIFVFLSIDEGAELHELMIRPFQEMLGIDSGLFFFAWIIPMTIIIFILGTIFVRFFLSLPRKVKMLLFLSAFIFLLGAIGIEMISGAYWQANNFVYNMNYRILNAIEEGLENFGSIIAIYALIVYTKGNNKIIKKII